MITFVQNLEYQLHEHKTINIKTVTILGRPQLDTILIYYLFILNIYSVLCMFSPL